jgi:hypothetical protein
MTQVKHVFKWYVFSVGKKLKLTEHRTAYDAEEVYVTGTFDNWSKTQKLEKAASGGLEKEVNLPINEKITYKVHIPFPVTSCTHSHSLSVKHGLIHWDSTM